MWEENEEGSNDESSYPKHKIKRQKFQSSKKNIQGTHHPLIMCGSKKKRRVMMTAAIQIQNTRDTSFNRQRKHLRCTPPNNQGWEEKEEGSNDESSHSKHKIKRHTTH